MAASLLEREGEIASVDALILDAVEGSGGLLAITGAAGVGKTRLLDTAAQVGEARGLCVLRARGGEMERDLAWGVVRDLFSARIAHATEKERAELLEGAATLSLRVLEDGHTRSVAGEPSSHAAALHGLYWLTTNLAGRLPLLLVIDDAHWADLPSLRWVAYLASRLEGLPVAVVLGARDAEPGAHVEMLARVYIEPSCRVIVPRPLSERASVALLEETLDQQAAAGFGTACHEATAGNPFLLTQLAAQLRADGVAPTEENAAVVEVIKSDSVARTVLLRLARLSPDARGLAEAVAVLGTDVRLREAAELAGLDDAHARRAGDALAGVQILARGTTLDFVHPLVRHTIREELPPLHREELHRRAARILDRNERPVDAVAVHLLAVEPRRDPWAVDRLRAASREAMARGAPDVAVSYLRRALSEPPLPEERADLLHQLGVAEVVVNGATGIEPLRQALELSPDPHRRAEIALDIGRFLGSVFYALPAVDALQQGLAALGENDDDFALRQRLEIELVSAGIVHASTVPLAAEQLRRLWARVPAGKTAESSLLVVTALMTATARSPASRGADLAWRAVEVARVEEGDQPGSITAVVPLIWADRLEDAALVLRDRVAAARRRGWLVALAWATTHTARVAYRLGELRDAEADAREGLAILEQQGWEPALPYAVGPLTDALIEVGELNQAEKVIERCGLHGHLGKEWPNNEMLHSRGRLRIAQGRLHEGLEDVRECGRRLDAWGGTRNPAIVPWRSTTALALTALGEHEEALRLATEEVALAREFETPRALGIALRARGLVLGGTDGIDVLGEAAAVLRATPARLEHARALVDLGALTRRVGRRIEAQPPLREGLDMASGCGATVLAQRAREELVAAGAKPRRDAARGRDALTAGELRVVRMAAEGTTNSDIAQALFLTARTVETHLTHAYQKLDITSRRELSRALESPVVR